MAVGADGACAVAANFALPARRAGGRRLFGAAVDGCVERRLGKRLDMSRRQGKAARSRVGVYFHCEGLMEERAGRRAARRSEATAPLGRGNGVTEAGYTPGWKAIAWCWLEMLANRRLIL